DTPSSARRPRDHVVRGTGIERRPPNPQLRLCGIVWIGIGGHRHAKPARRESPAAVVDAHFEGALRPALQLRAIQDGMEMSRALRKSKPALPILIVGPTGRLVACPLRLERIFAFDHDGETIAYSRIARGIPQLQRHSAPHDRFQIPRAEEWVHRAVDGTSLVTMVPTGMSGTTGRVSRRITRARYATLSLCFAGHKSKMRST